MELAPVGLEEPSILTTSDLYQIKYKYIRLNTYFSHIHFND